MNAFAQKYLREKGAINKIIVAVKEDLLYPSIAKSGVSIIGVLAEDEINREILISVGAHDIAINALAYHLQNDEIIDICCKTLARLALNNSIVFENIQDKTRNYFNLEYADYIIQMIIYYQHDNCSQILF
jgi:hypothetical protein